MNILQSIFLGILQGLTEFLPISSSGHILLFQRIFGITELNLFYTVMLHVGTLIAVVLVFYKDIIMLFKQPFGKMVRYLLFSTIITGVVYLLLKQFIDSSFEGAYLGYGFLITAVLLYFSDKILKGTKTLDTMKAKDSAIIGFVQGIAIMPGISRSGSTITGGLFAGLDKSFAAKYSFLLSIPAILAGAVLEAKDITAYELSNIPWVAVIIGVIFAAISGIFAIKIMLKIIKKKSLSIFSIYLIVLGLLIISDQLFFHIVF